MLIHTVKGGDDLFSIARKYSTYPQKLLSDNYPLSERLNEGDEILVLIPTKTANARESPNIPILVVLLPILLQKKLWISMLRLSLHE